MPEKLLILHLYIELLTYAFRAVPEYHCQRANRDVNYVGHSALQLAESWMLLHVRRLDGPKREWET